MSYIEYKVTDITQTSDDLTCYQNNASLPFATSAIIIGTVQKGWNVCVSDDLNQTFELQLSYEIDLEYLPGDTIGILPQNSVAEVNELINLLNLNETCDKVIEIKLIDEKSKKNIPKYIPERSTIRNILMYCLDIRAVIKKTFLKVLSSFTKDEAEKQQIEVLYSKNGANTYQDYIINKRTTLLDLLNNFKSCKPKFTVLMEHLPRLMPRPYSIASSSLNSDKTLSIIFNVIEENKRKGLCSSWLASLIDDNQNLETKFQNLTMNSRHKQIYFYLRKQTDFVIPNDLSIPLILIGTGVGIAPFIGFLRHRKEQFKSSDVRCSNIWLIFGCQSEEYFIFKDELQFYLKKNILTKMTSCFSRVNQMEKQYVQDCIWLEHKKELVKQLNDQQTKLYICGSMKMIKNVKETLRKSVQELNELIFDEADIYIKSLELKKRLLIDSWL